MSRLEALERDGFLIMPAVFSTGEVSRISSWLDACPPNGAGMRALLKFDWCRALADRIQERMQRIDLLDPAAVAMQCNLFAKRAARNWKVGLHQDVVMPVAGHVEHEPLPGRSFKDGGHYARLPDPLLEDMLAVRLHVDPCLAGDGPLQVVPGSHREGVWPVDAIAARAGGLDRVVCELQAGDLLLMRPLLLHASSKATRPVGERRVLHYVFGPADPGHGLAWSCHR